MNERKAINLLTAAAWLILLVFAAMGGLSYINSLDAQGTPVYVINATPAIQLSGTWGAGKLQAAVNQLSVGGTIRLTATYNESPTSTITISTNYVKILCDPGAQIISNGAANIFNVSGTGVEVANCNLSGATQQTILWSGASGWIHDNIITNGGATNPGSGTAASIELENSSSDTRVERNTITATGNTAGATNNGADIVANYTTNQSNNGTFRLHVIGNHISGSVGSAFSILLFNISDSEIRQNIIDGNNKLASTTASGYGVACYNSSAATGPASRNQITDNNIANTAGTGIYNQGCQYSLIEKNTLTNVAQQQLDSLLTVGAIGCNAGNTASPTAPGVVMIGNTIHTSGKEGISLSHCPGALMAANSMDGIGKYGIEVGATSDQNPIIADNQITLANTSTASNIAIFGTTGALIKGNYTAGCGISPCIYTDTSSPNATVEGNEVTANIADSSAMWIQGNNSLVDANNFYGLATFTTGEAALRITGSNQAVRNNTFNNTSIQYEIFNTACSVCTFEENTINHTTGSSYAILEQAAAANNVYRRNIVTGGTSPGWNLAGTIPTHYENSFNGAIEATQVTSLTIGPNTILPARLTGVQGSTGVNLSIASGAFVSGNLRKTDASGNDVDSGVQAASTVSQLIGCGTTTTCGNSVPSGPRIAFGQAPLSSGAATVTGVSPAWSSTTSAQCTCSDLSTATNSCQAKLGSTSSIALAGTGSDTVSYICAGN